MPNVTERWTEEQNKKFLKKLKEQKILFCKQNHLPIPQEFNKLEDYMIPLSFDEKDLPKVQDVCVKCDSFEKCGKAIINSNIVRCIHFGRLKPYLENYIRERVYKIFKEEEVKNHVFEN